MDWFRRYGIPGAYCMGLTLVWLMILYPCRVNLSDKDTATIIGVIFTVGFLPFGYLMCLTGQWLYILSCLILSRYGGHSIGIHIAEEDFQNNSIPVRIDKWAEWAEGGISRAGRRLRLIYRFYGREIVLEACSVLQTVSRKDFDLKGDEHVQEWIRKRHDIVVMNQAIMAGTIVCTIGAACLNLLPDWSLQPYDSSYVIYASVIVACLMFITWHVTNAVRIGIDIVIAGMLKLRHRGSE